MACQRAEARHRLKHIPSGWVQPDGMCYERSGVEGARVNADGAATSKLPGAGELEIKD